MEYTNIKKITKNVVIILEPDFWDDDTDKQIKECHSIIRDIRRHVDGIKYYEVSWDDEIVCCLCLGTPDPDETGMPQCCLEAQDFFLSESKKQDEEEAGN